MTDDAPKKRHYCSACDCIHEDGKCLAPPDAQPEAGEEIVRVYVCDDCFTIARTSDPCGRCGEDAEWFIAESAYDTLAAKLAQAERKILGAKEYQRAIEQALDGANSECARLTRELEATTNSLSFTVEERNAELRRARNAEIANAALREVVEAASVVASCWNTQDDKVVVVRYPKAEEVRRYFTAWDALAALEGGEK